MAKAVLIARDAGAVVSEDYLKKVFEAHNHCFGASAIFDGVLQTLRFKGAQKFEDVLQTINETLKDSTSLFFFGGEMKNLTDDEIQPFTMLEHPTERIKTESGEETKVCLISAGILGDFNPKLFHKDQSNRTDQWFVNKMFLMPKLSKEFNALGKDGTLEGLVKELRDSVFKRDLEAAIIGDGTIIMLTANGDIIEYGTMAARAQFDGWWTTDGLGLGKPVAGTPLNKLASGFRRIAGIKKSEAPPPAADPAATPQPEAQPPAPSPEPEKKSEPAVAATSKLSAEALLRVKPPAGYNKQMKGSFYDKLLGNGLRPNKYKEGPEVEIAVGKLAKYTPQELFLVGAIKAIAFDGKNWKVNIKPEDIGVSVADPTPAAPTPEPQKEEDDQSFKPIVPAEEKKMFVDVFKKDEEYSKAIATHGGVINDATALAKYKEKWPSFEEQSGDPLHALQQYPDWVLYELVTSCPMMATVALRDALYHMPPWDSSKAAAPSQQTAPRKIAGIKR